MIIYDRKWTATETEKEAGTEQRKLSVTLYPLSRAPSLASPTLVVLRNLKTAFENLSFAGRSRTVVLPGRPAFPRLLPGTFPASPHKALISIFQVMHTHAPHSVCLLDTTGTDRNPLIPTPP